MNQAFALKETKRFLTVFPEFIESNEKDRGGKI